MKKKLQAPNKEHYFLPWESIAGSEPNYVRTVSI